MLYDLSRYWPKTYITVGVTAFLISALGMPIAIWALKRLGVMDRVADNKIHKKPVPRGGGIVIFLAFAIAVLLPDYRNEGMKGVLLGAFICLVVGAIDDYVGGIPGFYKLITLLLVTLILSNYGVRLHLFKDNEVLDIAFTMLWIVGVTSAFNGIDNMDGLASGVTVIVALMYFVMALQVYLTVFTENRLSWFGLLAIGLIGANLGFLIYNFHPARIFMGDSGSFFLGFTVAALGVMGEWSEGSRLVSCIIPVLILGVPLFDFAYIIITRIARGETRTLRAVIDHCAPDHLSHRLMWLGFSQRQAVLFIYLICVAMGVSGMLLHNTESLIDSALALAQGLAVISVVIILMTTSERRHTSMVQGLVGRLEDSPPAHARHRYSDEQKAAIRAALQEPKPPAGPDRLPRPEAPQAN